MLDSLFSWLSPDKPQRRENLHLNKKEDLNEKDLQLLGFGQYSQVFLVEKDGKKCACKKSERKKDSRTHYDNLYSEVQLLQEMNHKNIIKLEGKWRTENYYYIMVEYCNQGDLKQFLKKHKRLPENEAKMIARQLVEAVDYCHSRRIIHRDIKPANILAHIEEDELGNREGKNTLLNSAFTIKLADFGFARKLEENEYLQQFYGTLSYMAPEVIAKNSYSFKADVWSIGATLFELLTGSLPFSAFTMKDLQFK